MKIKTKIKAVWFFLVMAAMGTWMTGCGAQASHQKEENTMGTAETTVQAVAEEDETVSPVEVVEEGMEPVYGTGLKDGTYQIKVDSSSSMFRVTQCQLTVKDGQMQAVMTMGGKGYEKLYMGTGPEAVKASEDEYIPYMETDDGLHTFSVPVEALDQGIDCSAFSKNKEKWYDRVLVFRADSLPTEAFDQGMMTMAASLELENGSYTAEVRLEGGSGRASVETPARIRVEDGRVFASVVWSSSNYDYMKVDDVKYEWDGTGEHSTFEIPVSVFDWKMPVIANTIAMSTPHEIEYTLTFDSATLKREAETVSRSIELTYAEQFSVDYDADGRAWIRIEDGGTYLVVPEGGRVPEGLPKDVTVIQKPLKNIYLAASSAMDLFRSLDGMGQITLSGTDSSGWYIEEAREALLEGRMVYAGKYSAPDYELILSKACDLAIESTMIYHAPEVKEQLEQLGIPVLVERSSYESHPLGRMEWLKLYGVLLNKEEMAEALFEQQMKNLEPVMKQKPTGKTVAFFYISSNGYVNVRKSGDYMANMIEMAGGTYVPETPTEEDNALSTMNMQMEAFYAAARDADIIIYNSTIGGALESLEELLDKSQSLETFKAVKEGQVWCTEKNLFQETMGLGDMMLDLHEILTKEQPDEEALTYLYRLR